MSKVMQRVWAALGRAPKKVKAEVITPEVMAKGIELVHEAAGIEVEAQAAIEPVAVVSDPVLFREPDKPKGVKCMLPGCSILTLHNGGYCSAEHCREHHMMLKQRKSA